MDDERATDKVGRNALPQKLNHIVPTVVDLLNSAQLTYLTIERQLIERRHVPLLLLDASELTDIQLSFAAQRLATTCEPRLAR
jgi:hypothetical protein